MSRPGYDAMVHTWNLPPPIQEIDELYDPEFDLTKLREEGFETSYNDEFMDDIVERVQQLRERMDLPFDEIYHREKSLIDNVVVLEKEIRKAIETQDPYDYALNVDMEEVFKGHEDMYESDIEYMAETAPQSISETNNRDQFKVIERDQRHRWRETAWAEWDKIRNTMKLNNLVNCGYAFVTFSHIDEAKKCMMAHEETMIGNEPLELFLKNDLDHGDFDTSYLHA